MRIYTKTGDDGTTGLVGGERVSKTCIRLESYGTVDELNSHIGVVASYMENGAEKEDLLWIQERLFAVGGGLATQMETTTLYDSCRIFQDDITRLEGMIDTISETLPKGGLFVLPGGCPASAFCNVARAVCRRAERCMLRLAEEALVDAPALIFINRLSDYLYVLSRHLNISGGTSEVFWKK